MLDRVLFFENKTGVTLTQRSNQSKDYLPQHFFQRPESTESWLNLFLQKHEARSVKLVIANHCNKGSSVPFCKGIYSFFCGMARTHDILPETSPAGQGQFLVAFHQQPELAFWRGSQRAPLSLSSEHFYEDCVISPISRNITWNPAFGAGHRVRYTFMKGSQLQFCWTPAFGTNRTFRKVYIVPKVYQNRKMSRLLILTHWINSSESQIRTGDQRIMIPLL